MVRKPVRSIIGAIDAAAARWTDPDFAPRARARDAVGARTGYSAPMVEYAFDRLFGALRRDSIEAVIADELGCIDVLDDFAERAGRPPAHALPLGRVCVISSRTTIGVALLPAIFALCSKCNVLVKDREDHLIAAFFETLGGELEALRDAATAQRWSGDEDTIDLNGFDVVVAFGNDAILADLASKLRLPARFIPFGSKASAGYVAREALSDASAAQAIACGVARDIVLYESEGCLSLHALFVETGGAIAVERFAAMVADALGTAAVEFPPVALNAQTAARFAVARDLATFRAGARGVYSDRLPGCVAILDPPFEEPPLFLPRTIGIRSVDNASQAAEYLERHGIALEALAVAGRRWDLLELAARTKAARIAPFGTLQAPPIGVFHGGRPRIAEFVRWLGDET
ncbi:MAG TPA: acyl-CoA reductase [Candidatus Cybelea sp.]